VHAGSRGKPKRSRAHKKAANVRRAPAHRAAPRPTTALTPEDRLNEELTKIWSSRYLRRGTTAIYVVDEATGAPLFAVHEKEPLNPASNVKLLSTATVLDVLGPDWRYSSRLLGPAPGSDGTARGDLYLLGTGDPTLTVGHLDELVAGLSARGVKRIEGDIVIGPKALRDGVARANVKVTVTGSAPGKPPVVRYEPESDYFQVKVNASSVKGKRGRVQVALRHIETDGAGHYLIDVWGRIKQGRTVTLWRAVPHRAAFTAHTLVAKLRGAGIDVTGSVRVEEIEDYVATAASGDFLPVELARHESAPMAKLVARVNKPSNNFLADRLLMTAGSAVFGGLPTMDKGLDVMKAWLQEDAGIEAASLTVDTGSGLSYATRITAEQIVGVLRAGAALDTHDPDGDDAVTAPHFLSSLAVAGTDGTLRGRFRGSPARHHVVGKTGTLTGVIALSGFVRDGDDSGLCFAIVTNGNRHRSRNLVRREHENLVEAMHDYLRARHQLGPQAGDGSKTAARSK